MINAFHTGRSCPAPSRKSSQRNPPAAQASVVGGEGGRLLPLLGGLRGPRLWRLFL